MEKRDLRSEVYETLEQYPVVASVFDRKWVDAQFSAGFDRGVHPMFDWLSAALIPVFAPDCHRVLSTMSTVFTALQNEKRIGRLKSKLARLKGRAGGKWHDNHRDWWSTTCELYLAAWLLNLGYRVRLGGTAEADIEVCSTGDIVCRIEVHTPRKGSGLQELIDVLRWSDSRFGYDLRIRSSSDQLIFSENEFAELLGRLRSAYESIESGQKASVPLAFCNDTGSVEITVGPGRTGSVVQRGQAAWTPPFSSLFPDIVDRANVKAGKGQLREDIPSVLALEMGNYYPSISLQHFFVGPQALGGFPTTKLRRPVAALIVYQQGIADTKPTALSVVENPASVWVGNEAFQELLALLASGRRESQG